VRHYNKEARAGRMLPFVIRTDRRLVGQMHLFGMAWGSLLSCAAGYWVAQEEAGRGIAPTALACAADYAMGELGLHRVEVNIRPENVASLAVVRKLGFRDEGLRVRYLHINGAWRDHRTFALTREDLGGRTLLERLHTNHNSHIGDTPPCVPGGGAEGP
jgi:ribosomal-protein-alanine N-acetyltransferase